MSLLVAVNLTNNTKMCCKYITLILDGILHVTSLYSCHCQSYCHVWYMFTLQGLDTTNIPCHFLLLLLFYGLSEFNAKATILIQYILKAIIFLIMIFFHKS